MIRQIILLSIVASACCQYPRQRAPPRYEGPPVEEFVEDYGPPPRQAPAPRQAPPQQSLRPNSRQSDVYRPASVHYVNIGHELAGDYKFGYDTGKGNDGQSFREETRLPDGSVQGAYGYVDETGQQRIVKYTAGKEGFKVLGDDAAKNTPRSAPAQPAPAPQQAYNPPPQQAYAPQPQPPPRPQPQPAYRPAPQPQPAYRPAPQPQPAYRPPPQQSYAPQPQPAPRPQPQPAPRRPQRPRYQEPRPQTEESYDDYDYPNNDISERRLVPVDTSLFNYNIGTSHSRK